MKICAITMAHNERRNLPRWLDYYGRQLGPDNLVVIDHGTDDESRNLIDRLPSRLRLARDEFDEERRLTLVKGLFAGLLGFYDVVIYADADEFLVADPAHYSGLQHYVEENPRDASWAVGLDVWEAPGLEGALDSQRPVLAQRSYARFSPTMCKPLLGARPMTWNTGFHRCQFPPELDGRLFLFHLKYADRPEATSRLAYTRGMKWSAASLLAGLGKHQRRADQDLERWYRNHTAQVRRGETTPFDFAAEIEGIRRTMELSPGGLWKWSANLPPRLVKIPSRFAELL